MSRQSNPKEWAAYWWAEGAQESGNNYKAVNAGSGALGRWQVMPGNLPGWARQCGLAVVSPAYFLSHPAYQDQMVSCVLGKYYDIYGWRGAASMWYSGQPNFNATYGNPPVYQYVNDIGALMGKAPGNAGTGGQGGVPSGSIGSPPAPNPDDWHIAVALSATQFGSMTSMLKGAASAVASSYR